MARLAQLDSEWLWCVHGHGVRVACDVPAVADAARRWWGELEETELPPGARPLAGEVRPYDGDRVARGLSADARLLGTFDGLTEVWRDPADAGVTWLLDERWGLCELDRVRRRWRAWLLDVPASPERLLERAVVWPMAQMLRPAGLHVLPAVAVEAGGWGVLLLGEFGLTGELRRLLAEDYAVVGQRWVALRVEDNRAELLRLPGPARDDTAGPRLAEPAWADLAADRSARWARPRAVLLVGAGRRGVAEAAPVLGTAAAGAIRDAWPMPTLCGPAPAPAEALASGATIYRVTLSNDPDEFAALLDLLRPEAPLTVTRPRHLRAA